MALRRIIWIENSTEGGRKLAKVQTCESLKRQ